MPNKRLKLAGGDRFKGCGEFVPWRARTNVQHICALRASRPQLKRDPLGIHDLRDLPFFRTLWHCAARPRRVRLTCRADGFCAEGPAGLARGGGPPLASWKHRRLEEKKLGTDGTERSGVRPPM